MSGRLDGRVAAITGSSRGIGRAVAEAFLGEGAKVVINSREQSVADRVAGGLGQGAVGVGAMWRPRKARRRWSIAQSMRSAGWTCSSTMRAWRWPPILAS